MADDTGLFQTFGVSIESGNIIFEEGDDGDKMYIIQEGNVRISKKIKRKDHELAIIGKGDFFGEMAIVTNEKRSATATAITNVKLLSFDRQGFLSMINKNAKIGLNIIEKLCRRVSSLHGQIQHLVKSNRNALVALNLVYAFKGITTEKNTPSYDELVQEISLNLELPLEEIKKCLSQFEKEGIIKKDKNKIKLLNKSKLEKATENVFPNNR